MAINLCKSDILNWRESGNSQMEHTMGKKAMVGTFQKM